MVDELAFLSGLDSVAASALARITCRSNQGDRITFAAAVVEVEVNKDNTERAWR